MHDQPEERPGPSQRRAHSVQGRRAAEAALRRPPQSAERLHQAGLVLSAVNFKRPRGPAPIAQFDSQPDMPSAGSCSTLGPAGESRK